MLSRFISNNSFLTIHILDCMEVSQHQSNAQAHQDDHISSIEIISLGSVRVSQQPRCELLILSCVLMKCRREML
jgi:hypothetical protein